MVGSTDTIRDTIAARATELGLSSYAIAGLCSDRYPDAKTPDSDTVRRYIAGPVALNSRYVSQICEVLGLELREKQPAKAKKGQ